MSKKDTVQEDAAAGSTGAGAIATAAPRLGDMRKRGSLKHYLTTFYKGLRNKVDIKPVQLGVLKEFYDVTDIVSRLKGMENAAGADKDDTTTFGIEDDNGNVMKVSVKRDQAKDFEYKLARDLADFKEDRMGGTKAGMTLAELLYNLKDEFDIVDVEFPEIPKDVIYNADKATKAPPPDASDDAMPPDAQNPEGQMGGDQMGGGDMGMGADAEGGDAAGGDMGGDDLDDGDVTLDDINGEGDDTDLDSDDAGMSDDDSVEDFEEEKAPTNPESLLQSVMDMLKADADAKKAQADAAAEEARAKQAEYSYKATQATVSHQEEIAQMEADMDAQKDKEKEAKKIANLAKHRVSKMSMMGESVLQQIVTELADDQSMQDLLNKRESLAKDWAPAQGDSPVTVKYKAQSLQLELQIVNAQIARFKLKQKYLATQGNNGQQQQQTQQQPAQAQQQPQGAAPQQGQPQAQ